MEEGVKGEEEKKYGEKGRKHERKEKNTDWKSKEEREIGKYSGRKEKEGAIST